MKTDFKKVFRLIKPEDVSSMKIEEESLWSRLCFLRPRKIHFRGWSLQPTYIFRLVIVLIAIIVCSATFLFFSFKVIKEDLLEKGDFFSNEMGTIRVKLPAGREFALFLFNTSDLWADTGVELRDGDNIRLSMSGAFHPSLGHLLFDADQNNPNPEKKWVFTKDRVNDTLSRQDSILWMRQKMFYVDSSAKIGNILYTVSYHPFNKDSRAIFAWDSTAGEKFNKVKGCGTLQLAINDIYFKDTANLDEYVAIDSIRFNFNRSISFYPDSKNSKKMDCLSIIAKDVMETEYGVIPTEFYKRMFYDDNLGQILVCLEIEHPLRGGIMNPVDAFRLQERWMSHFYSKHQWAIALLFSICAFIGVFLPRIILIMAIWLLVPLLIISALYFFLIVLPLGRIHKQRGNRPYVS